MTPSFQVLESIIEEETILQAQHERYAYVLMVTACVTTVLEAQVRQNFWHGDDHEARTPVP